MALVRKKIVTKTKFVTVRFERNLSDAAQKKCERYEEAGRRAYASLGKVRLD